MESLHLPQNLALTLNQYFLDHKTVKIQCLLTDKKFDEIIDAHYKHHPNHKINKNSSEKFDDFILSSFTVQNNKTDEELGRFQSLQIHDELYILCGSKAEFFDKIVLQLIRELYPIVLPAFIHSSGIYQILEHFETVMKIQLKKSDTVRKQFFGFSPRTKRDLEIFKKGRVYPTFQEIFEESKNEDFWIDSIRVFSGKSVKKSDVQFSISRKGLVTLYEGRFDSIFSNILHQMTEYSKEQREQFKHRSRSEQLDKKPKPLIVKFGKNIFEKIKARKEFSKILEKYPHCSYSVMYGGNSHVYLSVLDRDDNSSFAVRTYGKNSLLLIPQIKTSSLSLMRFSEYLASSFYEGVIENFDYEKERPIINK